MRGGKLNQPESVVYLKLDLLIPNAYQPRKIFNENTINELATSIKEYGVLNPILVRKKDDKYEIIAGERRYRAAKIAGLTDIPAIIKELDDSKVAEIALIENLQRENLSPIEEAKSYKDILKLANITEQQLSEMIGKSQSAISNKMRLLSLSDEVQDALNNHKISERHARSLLTVKDLNQEKELLEKIIKERLTVKELDEIINNSKENEKINQKEIEKESDNMNNGNFFPNYNNLGPNNNNVSLNTMNMQAMPNVLPTQPQAMPSPMPSVAPILNTNNADTNQTFNQPEQIAPTEQPVSPIPSFGVNNQPEAPVVQPMPEPIAQILPQESFNEPVNNMEPMNNFNDIPLFANQNINQEVPAQVAQPVEEPAIPVTQPMEQIAQEQVQPVLPPEETPLFTPQTAETIQVTPPEGMVVEPVNNNTFDVPVETPAMPEDKFTQVKNLLDTNGITYKAYNGETGNCIIIEL